MKPRRLAGLTPGRLRLGLGLFFVALALPAALLVHHAYGQLKWEAFHRHRALAEEYVQRVDARLVALVAEEEARAVTDYAFLAVAGDPAARYVQRSPLAAFPVAADLPGVIGHFQVAADGELSSPLLPASSVEAARYGVGAAELAARRARVARIRAVLDRTRLDDGTDTLAGARRGRAAVPGDTPEREAPAVDAAMEKAGAATERTRPESETSSGDTAASTAGRSGPPAAEAPARGATGSAPAADRQAKAPTQALFDRLEAEPGEQDSGKRRESLRSLGRVEELALNPAFRERGDTLRQTAPEAAAEPPAPAPPASRRTRKEQSVRVAPDDAMREADRAAAGAATGGVAGNEAPPPIRTFASDVDPFRFALLDGDHFVLYRKVWSGGQRIIQGALIARAAFLDALLREPFAGTALARASDLLVAWRGDVLAAYGGRAGRDYESAAELRGTLLHRARLSAPLGGLELIFNVVDLPPGPGAAVLGWVGAAFALVLVGGCALMYRLGLGQIRLARQQQDFVSAVSHELKTPLTSIRMYGEMLREGWVDEARRRTYYDYIHGESERLSRLIDNVLQLARMSRDRLRVAARPVAAGELLGQARAKVTAQVARAGFALEVACAEDAAATAVTVDPDHFQQIVINLVDNALKFAAHAERRTIVLGCRRLHDGTLQFSVRDYGPGVPRDQLRKIFRLFYRPGDELTRETAGTGIGLALVRQLAAAMGGGVDVVNRDPGAEFRVAFPVARPRS